MISEMVDEMVQTIDECFVQTETARGEVKEVAKSFIQNSNEQLQQKSTYSDLNLNMHRQSGTSNINQLSHRKSITTSNNNNINNEKDTDNKK